MFELVCYKLYNMFDNNLGYFCFGFGGFGVKLEFKEFSKFLSFVENLAQNFERGS